MKNSVQTSFLNVEVTAIPRLDSTGRVKYDTTFKPNVLVVTEPDTVINYQLVAPTPVDVIFKGLTIKPDGSKQFSQPVISKSGKLVTLSDANTASEKFNISIKFTDKDSQEFIVDPEVENDPRPPMQDLPAPTSTLEVEPEPENDPRK